MANDPKLKIEVYTNETLLKDYYIKTLKPNVVLTPGVPPTDDQMLPRDLTSAVIKLGVYDREGRTLGRFGTDSTGVTIVDPTTGHFQVDIDATPSFNTMVNKIQLTYDITLTQNGSTKRLWGADFSVRKGS